MNTKTDYMVYRGRCKEMVEEAIANDATLRAVRGHYCCPLWGDQPHWWCEKPDGTIIDPSAKQFPFGGEVGEYVEFNGIIECAECGKSVPENEARIDGNYGFCSMECNAKFVGVI